LLNSSFISCVVCFSSFLFFLNLLSFFLCLLKFSLSSCSSFCFSSF
jgi:hypothetical protein